MVSFPSDGQYCLVLRITRNAISLTKQDKALETSEVIQLVKKEDEVNSNISRLNQQVAELQQSLDVIQQEQSANRDPGQVTALIRKRVDAEEQLETAAEMLQAFESLLATIREDIKTAAERFHDEKFNEAFEGYVEDLGANREKRLLAYKELLQINARWLPKLNSHRPSFLARPDYDNPQMVKSAAMEIIRFELIPDVEVKMDRCRFTLTKLKVE